MRNDNKKHHYFIVYVLLVLIINMSVNIHDSMMSISSSSDSSNEIETLVELLMVSYDSTWVLPDTPDGADEDHITTSSLKTALFSCKLSSLMGYFPRYEFLYFPEVNTNYNRYLESPIPPPPIV